METNALMKIVDVEDAADVFTVEGSTTPQPSLLLARCEASRVAMRVQHSVRIYKNGELFDYKRF